MIRARRFQFGSAISARLSLPLLLWATIALSSVPCASAATIYPEVLSGDLCLGATIEVGIMVENNTTGPIELFNFSVCWDPEWTLLEVLPGDFGPVSPPPTSGNCLNGFMGTDSTPAMWNGSLFRLQFLAPPTQTGTVDPIVSITDYFVPMFFAQGNRPIPHDFDVARENGWCGPTPTPTETPTVTPTQPTPTPLIAAVYAELVSGDTCYPNTMIVGLNLEANEVGPVGNISLVVEWNPRLSFSTVSFCDYDWDDSSMKVNGNVATIEFYNSFYWGFDNGCIIQLVLNSSGFDPGPVDLIYSITDGATPELDTVDGQWIPHRFDLDRDNTWCGDPYTPTVTDTPTITPTPSPRTPDWNHDGLVDGLDLAIFLEQFHATGGGATCDLTGDNDADAEELFLFATWWGRRE